ncbi:outer membrane protein assembly factor BamC [Hydrogenophaga sp.]|uniref:outer membrane protein assembly factor BamC n=1 Tax=Hydrogenophaga sp. TaxID=1904254 RepID=UPI002BB1F067|nr:outer membrane protein assembly factor BamC [Hydrogenophaga sp.]HMP12109.1 outer membrane protein assembly factor BamC [Hydrogenophaga sp.]
MTQIHRPTLPRTATTSAVALAILLTSGCTILQEDRIDYKSAQRGTSLEVPPDLTQLSRDSRYTVPGGPVAASGFGTVRAESAPTRGTTAQGQIGDVRLERAGNQRWLVVDRPADALWGPIKGFWEENGFVLDLEQERLGIMETDWAENRAKIPQDLIRRTIGRLFDNLYSTGERDRFRTRLERRDDGTTEIYISHRGMIEVYTSTQREQTRWQPRPRDVELETEFLRRLMVRLGVSEAQAQASAATAPAQPAARLVAANGIPVLQVDDGFDRAWRRVGLALDRTSFTVEDRDRSQGVYFVRYVEPVADSSQPGLLGRMLGARRNEQQPVRYRVVVRSADNQSTISVLDANGQPDATDTARRILSLLSEELQ